MKTDTKAIKEKMEQLIKEIFHANIILEDPKQPVPDEWLNQWTEDFLKLFASHNQSLIEQIKELKLPLIVGAGAEIVVYNQALDDILSLLSSDATPLNKITRGISPQQLWVVGAYTSPSKSSAKSKKIKGGKKT